MKKLVNVSVKPYLTGPGGVTISPGSSMPFLNEAWVAFLATSDVKKKLEEGLLQVVETPDPKGKARADAIELPVGEMPRNDIAPKRGLSETPMRKRSAARQSTRWMQT